MLYLAIGRKILEENFVGTRMISISHEPPKVNRNPWS